MKNLDIPVYMILHYENPDTATYGANRIIGKNNREIKADNPPTLSTFNARPAV